MIRSVDYLKTKFETRDQPTQDDFWDWLDSFVHKTEVSQPIQNRYNTISEMIFDQSNQIGGYLQYADGLYYEYLGTPNGLVTDYNEVSSDPQNASEVPYSNTVSGLTAINVQDAIDETITLIGGKSDIGHTHTASDIIDFDTEVSNNTDVAANTADRHTHANKVLLDTITDSGAGDKYLSDDGTYKEVSADIDQFTIERHSFTAGNLQTDFTISGAVEGEIVDILSVRIEGISQDSNSYSIVNINVARDTVRFVTPLDDGDSVVIEYFKGTVCTTYPNPDKLTDLTDTPSGYSSNANKILNVKSDETGVEFTSKFDLGLNDIRGFDILDEDSMGDISWDDSTRTLSISPKSGQSSYHFWVKGVKIIKTSTESVSIPDTTGTYYFYFDEYGSFQYIIESSVTVPIIYKYALVALVYWNKTEQYGFMGNERHGRYMNQITHVYNHLTYGARYESGMNPTGFVSGTKTYTNTLSGYFWDEDIRHDVNTQTTNTFLYRYGPTGEWTKGSTNNEYAYKESGDTYYSWNEWTGSTWQLTEGASDSDFWITFFVATPSYDGNDVFKIIGQNSYATRGAARDSIYTEINNLKINGLPSPEFVFLYAIIVKRDGNLIAMDDGSLYLDLRIVKGGQGSSATSSYAEAIFTNTDNFDGILSSTEDNVQKALDTLDGINISDINDTSISSETVGDVIEYDGSEWKNKQTGVTGTYSATINFDKNYYLSAHTQTADITFSIGTADKIIDRATTFKITSDGSHDFIFSGSYDWTLIGVKNNDTLDAGTYRFAFIYEGNSRITVMAAVVDEELNNA